VTWRIVRRPGAVAAQHLPQFGHGEVGRHLLHVALDAGLRLVLDEHRSRLAARRVQLGLARAVAAHGVEVHAGLDHLGRDDGGAGLVGGDGGHDVGARTASAVLAQTASSAQAVARLRTSLAVAAGRRRTGAAFAMPSRSRNASAWNSLCAPLPISAIAAAVGPRQRARAASGRHRRGAHARW
jgi:hypothetical protein